MKKILLLLSVVLFAFLTQSCSLIGGSAGSCTVDSSSSETEGLKFCINYTGSDYDEDSVKSACEIVKGKYSEDDCNVEDSKGTCIISDGKATEAEYMYDSKISAADAEEACKLISGKWEAN